MPWNNVPKEDWPKMERCTKDLKAKGKSEQSAIAICYTSIVGKVATPEIVDGIALELSKFDVKGGENMDNNIEKVDKKCPECGKMIPADKMKEHMAKEHADKEEAAEPKKEEKTETKEEEKKEGVAKAEEPKTEEVKEEPKVEETKPEVPAEKVTPAEEKPAEEVKKEAGEATDQPGPHAAGDLQKPQNPKHGQKDHKCGPSCPDYKEEKDEKTPDDESKEKAVLTESLKKMEELLATLTQKVDTLTEKVTAPAEGATDEKTSKVEKVDEPKVEEKPADKVEPAPEAPKEPIAPVEPKVEEKKEETPKEEVKKPDTSSEGAVFEKILGLVDDLEKRLKKVEASPAPSKVVVFSKGEEGATVDDDLTKVENRLTELAKMRETDPNFYRSSGYEQEAFDLVKQKKVLQAQAKQDTKS